MLPDWAGNLAQFGNVNHTKYIHSVGLIVIKKSVLFANIISDDYKRNGDNASKM